jgi:hypothetical protein
MSEKQQQQQDGGGTAAAPARAPQRDTRDRRAVADEVDKVRVEQFNAAHKAALRSRAGGMLPEDYPERDRRGNLTRNGMLAALRGGGSVLWQGRSIVNEADIPSDAELAGDDAQAIADADAGLDRQQAELDRQRMLLRQKQGQGPAADAGNLLGKATGDNPGAWGADAAHGSEAAARNQSAAGQPVPQIAPPGAIGKTAGQDRRDEQREREQGNADAANKVGGADADKVADKGAGEREQQQQNRGNAGGGGSSNRGGGGNK